jgi:hypothetical protein
MTTQQATRDVAPGRWFVQRWSGDHGYPAGFYVYRNLASGSIEWMNDATGPVRFDSATDAAAAISRAGDQTNT